MKKLFVLILFFLLSVSLNAQGRESVNAQFNGLSDSYTLYKDNGGSVQQIYNSPAGSGPNIGYDRVNNNNMESCGIRVFHLDLIGEDPQATSASLEFSFNNEYINQQQWYPEYADSHWSQCKYVIVLLSNDIVNSNADAKWNAVWNSGAYATLDYSDNSNIDITSLVNQASSNTITLGIRAKYQNNYTDSPWAHLNGYWLHFVGTVLVDVPVSVTVKNNFGGGKIRAEVENTNPAMVNSPATISDMSRQTLYMGAVEGSEQPAYGGYNVVWNDTEGSLNKSDWSMRNGANIYLGGFAQTMNTSKTLSSSENNYSYVAGMKKLCNVTVRNQISGTSLEGTVDINGQTYSSGTVEAVVEENTITVEAEPYYIDNGIKYYFRTWNDQYIPKNSTFDITEHTELIAKYRGYAIFNDDPAQGNYRNQRFNSYNPRTDQHITVYWDEHPNTDVTQYKIYRKVWTYNMIPVSEGLVATVSRGTTSWTDQSYLIADGQDIDYNIDYSVCAYYSINETTSDVIYVRVSGDNLPSADKSMAEEEITEEDIIVENYKVGNYPNPFNPATTINYQLPEPGHVTVKVYDVLGKEVAELVNVVKDMGIYNVQFNAGNTANLSSGIYVYTIQVKSLNAESPGFTASKKMLLMK